MVALNALESQLKEAVHLTGATWAACLERESGSWQVRASYRLGKGQRAALLEYLSRVSVNSWLSGAMTVGRARSRKVPRGAGLGCERMFVFPVQGLAMVILVGGQPLDAKGKRIWHLLTSAMALPLQPLMDLSAGQEGGMFPDLQTAAPYDLPRALERVLDAFAASVPYQAGWLAVHSGDILEIRAEKNCPQCLGNRFPLESSEVFRRIGLRRRGVQVRKGQPEWSLIPHKGFRSNTRDWAGLPLVIGRRLIGVVALWREKPFRPDEWARLQRLSRQAARPVEAILTFAEMTGHLRRLGVLNDFALTVSSAQSLDQIARRVFDLLARAFRTELISLFLLSPDGKMLRTYRNRGKQVATQVQPLSESPYARLILDGAIHRETASQGESWPRLYEQAQAALIVPLRYRGRVIGALTLESEQEDAFNVYDEHLLVVIASHLAGLVEYSRLREEAEARARNLGLIHEVVQQVIALTDVRQVAQITADLLAQYFAYEMAVVFLPDDEGRLVARGVGGTAAKAVRRGLEALGESVHGGITGEVFRTGKSMLVNDVSQEPAYRPVPGWEVGSELCVALRDGERVLGLIDVESQQRNAFTHNDLLALESLAGILSSVILSAERYQRLQATVRELRATQRELQERIEAQRSAENRLVQAAKMAAVGEMAAGIAHELNNPLTTVAGFAELVLDELPSDSQSRKDMELILREALRARSVVRRLLDFARQTESVRVRADLNEVVDDVVTLMRHLFHTSGVQLHLNLRQDLPWPLIDRNQMKQVILNLLHNALQAMPEGGDLTIVTAGRQEAGRQWVGLEVRDTGVGIPPENLERLFEPFFTTRADEGGTGLGLSVTYGIVTDHGGYIDVDSEPGKGAVFTVWLPVDE